MKSTFFGMCVLALTGCSAPFVPIDKWPRYGDAVPGTIHVIASRLGFERPGHYYLPEGATLGLLIDVAGWKPVPADVPEIELAGILFRLGSEHFLSVGRRKKGERYREDRFVSHLDKNGMPFEHRKRRLLDGDEVWRGGITF